MTRKRIDWEVAKNLYTTTQTGLQKIADIVGTSQASVRYHVKSKQWTRPASEIPATGPVLTAPGENDLVLATGAQLPADNPAAIAANLAALQERVVKRHQADIDFDQRLLKGLVDQLATVPRLTPLQRINALATVVKIRETLIKLERQAHRITEASGEARPVAVQVNVNISPQDAYREMLGKP